MERLFKVENVYRTTFDDATSGARRPKVEITLSYHGTQFSSQSGVQVRKQYKVVSLVDKQAETWTLERGQWVVATLTETAYESKKEPGHMLPSYYLDRYVPVYDFNML